MTETLDDGWICILAPATVANVGPGFDCLGFSLGAPGDVVKARLTDEPGVVRIDEIRGALGEGLPREVERNCAGVAARSALAGEPDLAARHGVQLIVEKAIAPGSGLGSSASSAVGGAVATLHALARAGGRPIDEHRALAAALDGEAVASGARHADNVAPCLLGGFTLVQAGDPPPVARLEPALRCQAAVVTPDVVISTREAREALPERVSLADAKATWANVAGVVAALLTGDEPLLRRSLDDPIVTPVRARLIPGYADARTAALEAGALGFGISGSGPTVFALARDAQRARAVAAAVAAAFERHGLAAAVRVGQVGGPGARRAPPPRAD